MPICYCSKCFPGSERVISTISFHTQRDIVSRNAGNHTPELKAIFDQYISKNQEVLGKTEKSEVQRESSKSFAGRFDGNVSAAADGLLGQLESHAPAHDSKDRDKEENIHADDDGLLGQLDHGIELNQENDEDQDDNAEINDDDDDDLLGLAQDDLEANQDIHPKDNENQHDLNGKVEIDEIDEEPYRDGEDDEEGEKQHQNDQDEMYHTYPPERDKLLSKLKGGYECPVIPPLGLDKPRELTENEAHSLKHYIAWRKSNGTVLAYNLHARVLQDATQAEILSLHDVKKLAMDLSGLKPHKIDMCPESCMAYTGEYEMMMNCCYVKEKVAACNEPRYSGRGRPRAQMIYISFLDVIKAMFANAETSYLLRNCDKMLQRTLHLLHNGANVIKTYSDFGDSAVHEHLHKNMGLFEGNRDIAIALSTDGAQLTMKKHSNTWIVLLILLNPPVEMRYRTQNTIVPFIVPGPNNPGNLDSFLYPLFQDMAKASEGIWMWDAVDSSYFVNHAYLCMILGDMLGSAKLSGMAGHSAVHGDRFSMIEGARSSVKRGAKYQYYPISPPANDKYNPMHPSKYDLDNLQIRTEKHYWETISKLNAAQSQTQYNLLVRKTGISHMPLAAALPTFVHPSFFPLDPFHLFFENIVPFLWDIWTIHSSSDEDVHIDKATAEKFGKLVVDGMKTLPPIFCGPVRDPHLKRQSQYKAYEWMALFYWYIIPIGIELEFDSSMLLNFSYLVEIVEFVMTIKARSDDDLVFLQKKINNFIENYEKLYVGNDPEKISRCRLCIFQLVHLPIHIRWYGSIRLGSQATVERTIGEAGHKIHSKKSPFVNMANIFFEKELVKVLLWYYPQLESKQLKKHKPILFGKI